MLEFLLQMTAHGRYRLVLMCDGRYAGSTSLEMKPPDVQALRRALVAGGVEDRDARPHVR